MDYPGRIIKMGEGDQSIVKAIHDRLAKLGYTDQKLSSLGFNGTFSDTSYDQTFKSVVTLYQSQHVDGFNNPLKADGEIGPLSWASIFGVKSIDTAPAAKGIAVDALAFAKTQIGVREKPLGSNRGPEVDQYLASVGLKPGLFWCISFVYFCFDHAARNSGVQNPFPKTGGCLDAWNQARKFRVTRADVVEDPSLIGPGSVFIIDHGGGLGHAGFVETCVGGALTTIEGNSNNDGSSNGIGVFELNRRTIMNKDIKGFITV